MCLRDCCKRASHVAFSCFNLHEFLRSQCSAYSFMKAFMFSNITCFFLLLLKAMSDCSSSIQLLCDHGASVNAKDGVSCCLDLSPIQALLELLCFLCFPCLSLFPSLFPFSGWEDTAGAGHSDVSSHSLSASDRQRSRC